MGAGRAKQKISNALIGIAGVHYVAFELSRRGVIALPTTCNTAAYDIVAARPDGTRHANIQVKASLGRPGFWPMPDFKRIPCGKDDFYVLVRNLQNGPPVECFIVTGGEARTLVREIEEGQRQKGRGKFPCIYVEGRHAARGAKERWKKAWDTWHL